MTVASVLDAAVPLGAGNIDRGAAVQTRTDGGQQQRGEDGSLRVAKVDSIGLTSAAEAGMSRRGVPSVAAPAAPRLPPVPRWYAGSSDTGNGERGERT